MDFRERAQFEAERYGADPWIFVRELLQNARDAGARHVQLETVELDGAVRLVCRDDGDGMSEAHAREYLFRLYASSKEGASGMAGRFGVGFWSILRFEPTEIVVRSWPRQGPGWEVVLDGKLERADAVALSKGNHGTELVLTRAPVPGVSQKVKAAARAHARYLLAKGTNEPLDVVIDGERITETLNLPPPSATFEKRGVRGVVALGAKPNVELFSKGLHVRSAASVDELLTAPSDQKSRPMDPLLEGLAPQVILDGDELNLVRSRSDARDDKALRRAVQLSQKELARLIERQLQFSRPVPWWRRALRPALLTAGALAFVVGGAWLASGFLRTEPVRPTLVARPRQAQRVPAVEPYRDPSARYHGPRTDALPRTAQPIDLAYWPGSEPLHFASFHLTRPTASPELGYSPLELYPLRACGSDCVNVSLTLAGGPGWVRLPVPSGYVLDVRSLSGDLQGRQVFRTPEGEPALWFTQDRVVHVSYRVGAGALESEVDSDSVDIPTSVPDVSRLGADAKKADALRRWVATNIEYTNDARAGGLEGKDVVTKALAAGAGDCDVQNAVLALVLQHAGIEARLTVGYVGREGRAEPLLHAWVEYWDSAVEGWRVTDASHPIAGGARATAARSSRPSDGDPLREEPVAVAGLSADRASVPRGPEAPSRLQVTVPAVHVPFAAYGLLGVGPAMALAFLLLRPRVKRDTQLDADHDVSRLLQGALARPEAFQHVPALFEQPLVPLRGGGAISLGQAYELAAAERLYSSDVGSPFAERAVKSGARVLDAMKPEGKVVAEALGGVNLDRWDRLLRTVATNDLIDEVNRYLEARGERWRLMIGPELTKEPEILPVPGSRDERWVVLNADAPWLARAQQLAGHRPQRALFTVIDEAALWLRLTGLRRGRLLAPLARAVMREELKGDAPAPPRPLERLDDATPASAEQRKVRS